MLKPLVIKIMECVDADWNKTEISNLEHILLPVAELVTQYRRLREFALGHDGAVMDKASLEADAWWND